MVNQQIEFVALPPGLPKLVWHRYSMELHNRSCYTLLNILEFVIFSIVLNYFWSITYLIDFFPFTKLIAWRLSSKISVYGSEGNRFKSQWESRPSGLSCYQFMAGVPSWKRVKMLKYKFKQLLQMFLRMLSSNVLSILGYFCFFRWFWSFLVRTHNGFWRVSENRQTGRSGYFAEYTFLSQIMGIEIQSILDPFWANNRTENTWWFLW